MAEAQIPLAGVKVLVVDDAATIIRAAEIYLKGDRDKPTGLIVKTCPEGFDAIPVIMSFNPDIVFMDVVMQKVDGFTICKTIKDNPDFKNTVVVMLTSKEGLFDRARGQTAGADDYITKPFNREQILGVIRKHISKRAGK